MRLKNIDLLKGVLIILVILGHIIPKGIAESFGRTIIYSFHMPLFIGISGFLFNTDKLVKIEFLDLIKKYRFRVIIPWLIAVVGYFVLSSVHSGGINLTELLKAFAYPFYHLWFIPAFLSWVFMTWFLKKNNFNNNKLLLLAVLISVSSSLLRFYPGLYQDSSIINAGVKVILHTFRPDFFFFFVLGYVFKYQKLDRPKYSEYILPFLGLLLVVYLFYNPIKEVTIFNYYFFNIVLLSLVLKICSNEMISSSKALEWVGVNSLAIYLWHVLPILIVKYGLGTENLTMYYTAVIALEIVFIIVYHYLLKIEFLRKYVFGM